MERTELIEKARGALAEWDLAEREGMLPWKRGGLVVAALRDLVAVFEEQQKPSDDEREALARALFIASDDFAYAERMAKAWDAPGPHGRARWYNYADAILAAGFRRPVSPENQTTERGER